MNIKRNIIFALENRKKDGIPITQNVPIRMRVVFASQRIEFTTGYRIDMEKWDADKQRVRNGCTNKLKQSASEINTELLRQYTEIQNVFKELSGRRREDGDLHHQGEAGRGHLSRAGLRRTEIPRRRGMFVRLHVPRRSYLGRLQKSEPSPFPSRETIP